MCNERAEAWSEHFRCRDGKDRMMALKVLAWPDQRIHITNISV